MTEHNINWDDDEDAAEAPQKPAGCPKRPDGGPCVMDQEDGCGGHSWWVCRYCYRPGSVS